ncbi:MAG: FtsX-like permease family protein [Candidatus Magasanikbacteria bacterium]|jgi:putative ABC transport system permease protein|nr:FtsX-like permease family protein [Candidatus Magasanikbacteria bacterium]MBT4314994.1 FtsX-like permease family protein [Candidatus Magasanikbacteria bacterium]MBT4546950.1 FtsX-like permease family protein [Candidatus Magasanikbacteria bacterium]MBT6819572.1 FtsX-like permease family protein [Candidatus Magasanikbacteria bacterium]
MLFKDKIQLSYLALMRQKLRSVLTIVALGIGIASVVIILSAGSGLESMIVGELDIYNPNALNIEVRIPGKGETGSATGMVSGITITTLKNSDTKEIEKHSNIDSTYDYVTGQEVIKYGGENKTVILFGYGANAVKVEKMEFLEGRFYDNSEEDSLSQVLVLGYAVKEDLFGEDTAVGKNVYMRGKSYKVVGVMAERGASFGFDYDSIVYIPTRTLQKRLLGTDYVMGIMGRVIDISRIDQTKEDVEYLLRDRHDITDPDKDDFQVTTMDEIRGMLETIVGGITLLLVALVCISLLVGGVGITNIMYVTVAERTFEIGLRKAVGAKSKDIMWQFLFEAMILTFTGGVVGTILGILISYGVYLGAVAYGLNWSFSVSLFSIILAIGFSTFVGLFFGIYPARKASNLDPITALRKE